MHDDGMDSQSTTGTHVHVPVSTLLDLPVDLDWYICTVL